MADTEDFIKYKEVKEDLQRAISNFLEVCSGMTPEMGVVRELVKLRGDFGRNKEFKWLEERGKIEEVAKERRRKEKMTSNAKATLQELGIAPVPLMSAPGSVAGSSVSAMSVRDELDLTIGRLHRLRMSGEISAEELKQRLDQMRI